MMKEVLMNRDNMNEVEANNEVKTARENMWDIIDNGGTLEDLEDMMMCDYGLEMDYLEELLF